MDDPWRDPGRAALLTNLASGTNRRCGIAGVDDRAAAAGLRHFRIGKIDELDDVLRQCALAGFRLLIVNAGDGTVCRLLDIIRARDDFHEEPVLALLRGGTTNMIHGDVGWKGRPDAALGDVLRRVQTGRGRRCERHVLRVRGEGPDAVRHGFFFGTNAVVRAVLGTRRRFHGRNWTGAASEALSAGAMLWRLLRGRSDRDPVLSPVLVEISRRHGEWQQVSHILLMAMSLERMLLGLRPLRRGQRAGLTVLNTPDRRLIPWLWRLVRGRLESLESLSMRGEFSWILDGEIHEHRIPDGVLTLDVGDPVSFLVKDGRP